MKQHVSEQLAAMRNDMVKRRDAEISMSSEILDSYITDHRDTKAYKDNERKVNALARAWDKMIDRLNKWEAEADKIEGSVDNFYGD